MAEIAWEPVEDEVKWEPVEASNEAPDSISMTPQERMRPPDETVMLDGQRIPKARKDEEPAFEKWMKDNNVREPYHPDQHYDYVGAFRAGEGRQKDVPEGHFTDRFKLPGHETFSDESDYARGPEGDKAGSWDGDRYIPAGFQGPPISPAEAEQVRQPLGLRVRYALAKAKANGGDFSKLAPAEKDALRAYTTRKKPEIGTVDAMNALGANAFLGEFGDEIMGATGGDKEGRRAYLKDALDQHPYTGTASQVLGAGVGGVMLPAGRLASAVQGAVTGYGASEEPDVSGQLWDAAGGAAAGYYGGRALEAAGGAAKGLARGAGSLAGRALELPGKGRAALEEWMGGTSLAQRGGEAPVKLGAAFGDTAEQQALKRTAAATAPPAEASATAPAPAPVEPQPVNTTGRQVNVSPQNLDSMSTADAYAQLMREDPRAGMPWDFISHDLSNAKRAADGGAVLSKGPAMGWQGGEVKSVHTPEMTERTLGHFERSIPTLNRMAAEASPEAAAIQQSRMPTNKESQDVLAALDRLAGKGQTAPVPQAPAKPAGENAAWYESIFGEVPEDRYADEAARAYGPNQRAMGMRTYETPEARRVAREAAFEKDIGLDDRLHNRPETRAPALSDQSNTVNIRGGAPKPGAPSAENLGPNDLRIYGESVKNGRDPRTALPEILRGSGQQPRAVPAQNETATHFAQGDETRAYPRLVDQDVTRTAGAAPDAPSEAQKAAPWDPQPSASARSRLQKQAQGARLLGRASNMVPLVGSAANASIDMATTIGQHLRAVSSGKMRPEVFAQKISGNPALAMQMAGLPGKMGYAGREISQALKQGGASAAKARAWVIANQPWFRAQLQEGRDAQAAPSSVASAP